MKSFRLTSICYITSKASGVTELGWGTKVEENWQETGRFKVLLPLSDHFDLVIFQVQGFKPLFLLQLSILILGFDLFPLSLNPCFSNPLPTLLSLRWDPDMVFPFSSWTDICHPAQTFYPYAEHLFGFLSTGYPRWFHHFIPHSKEKETFSWLNLSFRVRSALACHTKPLLACSWYTLSAPCPAQKREGQFHPLLVCLAIPCCVTFNKSLNPPGDYSSLAVNEWRGQTSPSIQPIYKVTSGSNIWIPWITEKLLEFPSYKVTAFFGEI